MANPRIDSESRPTMGYREVINEKAHRDSQPVVDRTQGAHIADMARRTKIQDILDACRWKNTNELRSLAETDGGLLTDELRRKACQSGYHQRPQISPKCTCHTG